MCWQRLDRMLPLLAILLAFAASTRSHAQEAAADPASGAIRIYQRHLSAMRHLRCRFTPSCSQYAIDAIAKYGVVQGSARAADRLMRCNTSSESRYPRGLDGLLSDPVDGSAGSAVSIRVPDWLLLARDATTLPIPPGASMDRRARLEETLAFAQQLEERGDCERASAELQRAGSMADTITAHAWAYARIGDCYFGSAQWYFADRAYLTSAMLAQDPVRRVRAGYAAAVSRFDAGAFAACAGLLAEPELAATVAREPARDPPSTPPGAVASLAGLCAFATGDWTTAGGQLQRAMEETQGTAMQPRIRWLEAAAGEGPGLPHRSAGVAGTMSAVFPGSGQTYCGNVKDGVRHLLFNAALIYTVVALASHEQVPAAVLVGTVALPFYIGNVLGARDAARRFDRDQRLRLLARAIDQSTR